MHPFATPGGLSRLLKTGNTDSGKASFLNRGSSFSRDFNIIGSGKGDKSGKLSSAMRAVTQNQRLFFFNAELVNIPFLETHQSALAKFIDGDNVSAPNTE